LIRFSVTAQRELERASAAIDEVIEQFGKRKVNLGTGRFLDQHRKTERDIVPGG